MDGTHPASSTVKTMSKRSSLSPFFVLLSGPFAIARGGYLTTKRRSLRAAGGRVGTLQKIRMKEAISGLGRDKRLCAFNFKPVATGFFDLTSPPEAASCRPCSSYRRRSLDS